MKTTELPRIITVRRQKVVLDADLAKLYGVSTAALNQAVKRNGDRFPEEFSFVLRREEHTALISQTVTSNEKADAGSKRAAVAKSGRGGTRKPPRVFTEHGALMAANVLRSPRAVEMSIYLIRAFVQMREEMLTSAKVLRRLAEIDRRLIEHDSVLREIVERLQPLLDAPEVDEPEKSKIGFHQGNR